MSERFIEHLVIGRFGNLIKGNTKKNESIYVVILTLTSTLALHLTEANKTPTIIDHILVSFSDRVSEQDVKNVGLPDNQFIHCTRKNCRMKKKNTNNLDADRGKIIQLICMKKPWVNYIFQTTKILKKLMMVTHHINLSQGG